MSTSDQGSSGDPYTDAFNGPGRDNSTLGFAKFTGELAYHGPQVGQTARKARVTVMRLLAQGKRR